MPANVAGTLENMYSSDDSYMIVTKDEPYMSCQGSDGFEFTELPDHITRLTLSLEYRAEIDCCNSGEIVLYDNDGWWLGTIWSGILPTTDTVFAWSTEEPYSYVQPDATFWAQVCAPGAMARYYDVAELECEYLEPPPPVPNIRITDDPGDQMMPAISGQTLVWQDNRNGDWDIYLYEIPATPGITPGVRLTDDPADQMMPSISGDLVVYQDNRNGDWDIYLLELSSMIETRLTDDPANQTKPRIDGRRVVYLDDREGCAVYLLDLDAAPPLVDFAASPLEGDRPLLVEFTDLSTDDQLWWWDWDFGDGATSASEHWPRFARDVHHIYDD
ncbi:MAG: hypothetical protein GTO22_08995, partial [Gemmatimonadales bacterium]|nr:hypothetical protein [Gemmatimonadales bacterium]